MTTKRYVLGFAFQGDFVWLIRKLRPAWQAGRINGVGGKVEGQETYHDCMAREFEEETGVATKPEDWRHFATLGGEYPDGHKNGQRWLMPCFTIELPEDAEPRTMEDEEVVAYPFKEAFTAAVYGYGSFLPNLAWLIPLARDGTPQVVDVAYGPLAEGAEG